MKFIFLVLLVLYVMLFVLRDLKGRNALKNRKIILDAIFHYNMNLKVNFEERFKHRIDYSVLEDYNSTVKRIFDWGYKNIVPFDVFLKIEPFIKED